LERHLDRQPIVTEIPSWKRGEVWALFLVALSLRLIAIVALGSHGDIEGQTGWSWGREPGALGESLFRDGTLSDPWGQGTGPTAWLTPVFPALVAICLKLFGGLTPGAAALLHVIHALVAAGTCLLLIEFGRVLGSPRAGRLAAWMFALYPASIWHAAHTVWDTTLIAAGLLGFLILVLRAGPGPGVGRSGKLGLAFGALLMINPAPVGILPFIALYLFPGGRGAEIARRAGAFLGAALLVCLPWMIRNALVIGTPALRSNLGVELHVGNNDAAQGRHEAGLHPSRGGEALDRYRALGEVAYSKQAGEEAVRWIRANPRRFLGLVLRRIQIFWVGESPMADSRVSNGIQPAEDPQSWLKWVFHLSSGGLAIAAAFLFMRGTREGLLLGGVLLLFPVPYYLTHVAERYRFPLDPILVFLDAWLILRILGRRARGSVASSAEASPSRETSARRHG